MSHISFDIGNPKKLFRINMVFALACIVIQPTMRETSMISIPFCQSPWALPVKNKFSNILDHI